MAKNSPIRLIGLIVLLLGIFATIVTAWAVYGKDVKENTKDIVELKEDGCKPANQAKFDVALVQKDITTIKEDIEDIQHKQEVGFKEVLKRLPK